MKKAAKDKQRDNSGRSRSRRKNRKNQKFAKPKQRKRDYS